MGGVRRQMVMILEGPQLKIGTRTAQHMCVCECGCECVCTSHRMGIKCKNGNQNVSSALIARNPTDSFHLHKTNLRAQLSSGIKYVNKKN